MVKMNFIKERLLFNPRHTWQKTKNESMQLHRFILYIYSKGEYKQFQPFFSYFSRVSIDYLDFI